MAQPEVVYFNDPDKERKGSRITKKAMKKLRQGDVTELFTSSSTLTAANTPTTSAKTWNKSDLKATLYEVSTLADRLTKQMEAEKVHTKPQLRRRKSKPKPVPYPQVLRERKEKEVEQQMSGTFATNKKGKQVDAKRHKKGKGRWNDNIKGLDPPVGRFKNGVLSLSQKEVKKISKHSL